MAKQAENKPVSFDSDNTPVFDENKRIIEQGRKEREQAAISPAAAPDHAPVQAPAGQIAQRKAPVMNIKPTKTTKTVKIILPMEYYLSLLSIKQCTDKSLQDLAAQAVMDFVDSFSEEQVNGKSDM